MRSHRVATVFASVAALSLLLLVAGCPEDGDSVVRSRTLPPPPPRQLTRFEELPGMNPEITEVRGFRVGSRPAVTFEVETDAGIPLALSELDFGEIVVSGPTTNYQLVLSARDLLTRSRDNLDGTWTYVFADPVPATYPAQLNADPSGDLDPPDERTGQPLVDGTYTAGIAVYRLYDVEGEQVRDAGNATRDFLFGPSATTIQPREVVGQANCEQCHGELRAHGAIRRDVQYCLLCHTAGAEDRNVASVAGGTPDVTIEFEVMIHKIHNGAHLPSVHGVEQQGTSRTIGPGQPYRIVGFGNNVHDYSDVEFPRWPNIAIPMPSDLTETSAAEDIRRGVTDCASCHGDPDGNGPLSAPNQGNLAFDLPTRSTCGSCHDDIDWTSDYIVNDPPTGMPPQFDDSQCTQCHGGPGIESNHRHPMVDPGFNPGLNVVLHDASDRELSGGAYVAGDGTFQVGEKVEVDFSIQDDLGNPIDLTSLDGLGIVAGLTGPTWNMNQVLNRTIPASRFSNTQQASYVTPLPETRGYQTLVSPVANTNSGDDDFTDPSLEIWEDSGGTPIDVTVWEIDIDGGAAATGSLAADSAEQQNYVDLTSDAATAGFTVGEFVEIGGTTLEYREIDLITGDRIWFGVPLRSGHAAGDPVNQYASTTLTGGGADYLVDGPNGQIEESGTWTLGDAVVATYVRDFLWPSVYSPPFNDTDELDDEWGEWAGKTMVDGTYRLGIWTDDSDYITGVGPNGDTYPVAAEAAIENLLFGSATSPEPYDLIARGDRVADEFNCNACHDQIIFHGDHRAGVDTCLQCHGLAGAEDVSRLTAALSGWPTPASTPETTINFRSMIHSIHRGAELDSYQNTDPNDDYNVVGFFSSDHFYDEVHFPVLNGGTADCAACHGPGNDAWELPADRTHPDSTEQPVPTQSWHAACLSCHDSASTQAHADLNTVVGGYESCAACHSPGRDQGVPTVHANHTR